MHPADAILLALLAIGDVAFLAYLRRRRARRATARRMVRCLQLAIQREVGLKSAQPKLWSLRRAS